MQWMIRDRVDVNGRALDREYGALMVPGDSGAQVWRVAVYDGDMTVDLTGQGVQAFFERPDGVTVVVPGSVAGNIVTVEIPRDVCLVAGVVRGILCLGDRVTAQDVYAAALVIGFFTVEPGPGSVLVDPETEFADITELSGRVDDCDAAIAANASEIVRVEGKVDDLADVVAGEGWKPLTAASGVTEGAAGMGTKTGSACAYRVEAGHHVIAAANVALSWTYSSTSSKALNSGQIPEGLRPSSRIVRICPVDGSDVYCRAFVDSDGYIRLEYIGRFGMSGGASAGQIVGPQTVRWSDIVIDWYV